jgi:hypothetical protein
MLRRVVKNTFATAGVLSIPRIFTIITTFTMHGIADSSISTESTILSGCRTPAFPAIQESPGK